MTRKDYDILAGAMRSACPEKHWDPNKMAQWEVTINRLVDALAADNPRFKQGLFIAACKPVWMFKV